MMSCGTCVPEFSLSSSDLWRCQSSSPEQVWFQYSVFTFFISGLAGASVAPNLAGAAGRSEEEELAWIDGRSWIPKPREAALKQSQLISQELEFPLSRPFPQGTPSLARRELGADPGAAKTRESMKKIPGKCEPQGPRASTLL